MTDEVRIKAEESCAALRQAAQNDVLYYYYDAPRLANTLRELLSTFAPSRTDIISLLAFRAQSRGVLVPDNFYTALLMYCGQMGLPVPLPEDAVDPYVTDAGALSWNADERCLMATPVAPVERIVIDFTVTKDGLMACP